MQFNSSVLIKSNKTFILFRLLMKDMFLTYLSYSNNAIEYNDDEKFTLSKKKKIFK